MPRNIKYLPGSVIKISLSYLALHSSSSKDWSLLLNCSSSHASTRLYLRELGCDFSRWTHNLFPWSVQFRRAVVRSDSGSLRTIRIERPMFVMLYGWVNASSSCSTVLEFAKSAGLPARMPDFIYSAFQAKRL